MWFRLKFLSILEPLKCQWLTSGGRWNTVTVTIEPTGRSWREWKWSDFWWSWNTKVSISDLITNSTTGYLPSDVTCWVRTRTRTIGKSDLMAEPSTKLTQPFVTHPNKASRTDWSASLYQKRTSKYWKRAENSKVSNLYQWLKLWSVSWDLIQLHSQLNIRRLACFVSFQRLENKFFHCWYNRSWLICNKKVKNWGVDKIDTKTHQVWFVSSWFLVSVILWLNIWWPDLILHSIEHLLVLQSMKLELLIQPRKLIMIQIAMMKLTLNFKFGAQRIRTKRVGDSTSVVSIVGFLNLCDVQSWRWSGHGDLEVVVRREISRPFLSHWKANGWVPAVIEQVTVTIEPMGDLGGKENGRIFGDSVDTIKKLLDFDGRIQLILTIRCNLLS